MWVVVHSALIYMALTGIARTDKKVIFFIPSFSGLLLAIGTIRSKDNWPRRLLRCFRDISEDCCFTLSVIGMKSNAVLTVKVGHGIAANVPFAVG